MITDEEAAAISQAIVDDARDAGQAAGLVTYHEEHLKTVRARLKQTSNLKTDGQRDDFARTQPEYLTALKELARAKEMDRTYRALQAGRQAQLEVWRTHAANVRGIR